MLKLYVLIRDDISEAQQAVQAGHAVAQFGLDYPDAFEDWQDEGNVLVYLSVKNIDHWKTVLADSGFDHSVFHEPDYTIIPKGGYPFARGGTDTAIAVAPNWTTQYLLFPGLPLALSSDKAKPKRWWRK